MSRTARHLAIAAAMICTANPALAQHVGFGPRSDPAAAASAGLNLRLELGQRGRPRPVARLGIGRIQHSRGSGELPEWSRSATPGLELGLSRRGRAELYVAGQTSARVTERLGLDGSGMSPVWIVGGAVLLVVGVLVITNLDSLGDSEPAN